VTTVETVLVFAVAPLAVVLVLALLTIGPAARNRRPRYKPGQPWSHEPIWYEPHPDGTAHGSDHGDGETTAIGSSVYPERHGAAAEATHAVSGGSSGVGSAAGASAARAPRPAGPLGGARGTW
jgi:hypothetical protein